MAGGRHRQKFGQPLDNAEESGLKKLHGTPDAENRADHADCGGKAQWRIACIGASSFTEDLVLRVRSSPYDGHGNGSFRPARVVAGRGPRGLDDRRGHVRTRWGGKSAPRQPPDEPPCGDPGPGRSPPRADRARSRLLRPLRGSRRPLQSSALRRMLPEKRRHRGEREWLPTLMVRHSARTQQTTFPFPP